MSEIMKEPSGPPVNPFPTPPPVPCVPAPSKKREPLTPAEQDAMEQVRNGVH
jgi:hypothetical protein